MVDTQTKKWMGLPFRKNEFRCQKPTRGWAKHSQSITSIYLQVTQSIPKSLLFLGPCQTNARHLLMFKSTWFKLWLDPFKLGLNIFSFLCLQKYSSKKERKRSIALYFLLLSTYCKKINSLSLTINLVGLLLGIP